MTKKKAKKELIKLLLNQVEQLSIMSKIELGDDVIFEIQRLQKIINSRKVKPLTEGKEKLNFKKNPPLNKTTPPPPVSKPLEEGLTRGMSKSNTGSKKQAPPPPPPKDRVIREGEIPRKPKNK